MKKHFGNRITAMKRVFALMQRAQQQNKAVDQSLNTHFRQNKGYGSRDRKYIAACIFGFFRWSPWLMQSGGDTPDKPLLLGYALDGNPIDEFILHWNTTLEKPCSPTELQGIAHTSLTEKEIWVARELEQVQLPALFSPAARFSAKKPEIWVARPPTWLRCYRGQENKMLAAVRDAGLDCRRAEHTPQAFAFTPEVARNLRQSGALDYAEVQDIASQQVGLVCNPAADTHWFDACAGAGGKTLHLADLLGDSSGSVTAYDIRQAALTELQKRARRHRIESIRIVRPKGGRRFAPKEQFDGVLVDAPCSNSGTWRRNPWLKSATRPRVLKQHARVQFDLLCHNASWVASGGVFVYATCSQFAVENEAVIKRFLKAEPAFTLKESRYYTPPLYDGDTLFVARMQKIE